MDRIFSIIIPVYNGVGVVERALDSIYSQGLLQEEFEVICVDDCSPTMQTYEALNNYMYAGRHPENLLVIRHEINKRQGGARNTGFEYASGKWIMYLDHDDVYVEGSLFKLKMAIEKYAQCDVIMFDYKRTDSNNIYTDVFANSGFYTAVMQGTDFIQKFPIPYGPVFFLFKRSFLDAMHLRFVEGVRFEDTDYVIYAIIWAKKITFVPIVVYNYLIVSNTTSAIGTDVTKQHELMFLCARIGDIVSEHWYRHKLVAMSVLGHYNFHYKDLLKRALWRLRFKDICTLIKEYPICKYCDSKVIKITYNYPQLYALLAQIARPFLLALLWMRTKMLRTNKS